MDENTPTTAVPQTDYVDKTYKVMQVAYGKDFTLDDKTFRSKIQSDTNYANKVYQVMQHQYGDKFTLDSKAFNAKLGNSQQPVQQGQQPQGKMSFAEWKDSPQYSEGSSYDDYIKGESATPETSFAQFNPNNQQKQAIPQPQSIIPEIQSKIKLGMPIEKSGIDLAKLHEPNYTTIQKVAKDLNLPTTRVAEEAKKAGIDTDKGADLTMGQSIDIKNNLLGESNKQNTDDYFDKNFGSDWDAMKDSYAGKQLESIASSLQQVKNGVMGKDPSTAKNITDIFAGGIGTVFGCIPAAQVFMASQTMAEQGSNAIEALINKDPSYISDENKGSMKKIMDVAMNLPSKALEHFGYLKTTKEGSWQENVGNFYNTVWQLALLSGGGKVIDKIGSEKGVYTSKDLAELSKGFKLLEAVGEKIIKKEPLTKEDFDNVVKTGDEIVSNPDNLQKIINTDPSITPEEKQDFNDRMEFNKQLDAIKPEEKTGSVEAPKIDLTKIGNEGEKIENPEEKKTYFEKNLPSGAEYNSLDGNTYAKDADNKLTVTKTEEKTGSVEAPQVKTPEVGSVGVGGDVKNKKEIAKIVSENIGGKPVGSVTTDKANPRDIDIRIEDEYNKGETESKMKEMGYEFVGSSSLSPKEMKLQPDKNFGDGWQRIEHFEDKEGNKIDVWHNDNSELIGDAVESDKKVLTEKPEVTNIPEELKPKEEDELKGVPLENINEKEYPRWVLANSEDPSEIASAYHQETTNTPFQSLKDWQKSIITGESGYGKTTEKSFINHSDKNNITDGLAKMWFNNKKGVPLDRISSELTNDEVSPSDIADFMEDVATKQTSIRKTTDIQNALRKKYKEITGRSINSHRESMDDDIADIINKEGITLENFDAIKKAYPDFMFDTPEDKEDYFNKVKTRLENGNKKTETKQEPASTTETGQTVSGGEKTDRAAIEKDYKERLAEHDSKIAEATTDYNKKQFAYDKAKSELSKNAKQDQADLFKKGTPSDEMLFKNDIKEQEDMVKNLKKEADSAKDNLDKLTKERDNVQPENQTKIPDEKLSKKEQALKDLEDARAAFRKAGGLSSGGLESLPEFVNLVKAYIKAGYETAKEFIEQFRKDYPELSDKIADKDIEDKFNDAVKEKEEDEKPKSFNDHVFESINSATDAADLKNKLSDKEKEFRDAGKYDEADKIKELNNSIKDGDDIGDITNKILDNQIKEADPFRKTKTDKAKEFISDSAIGNFGKKIFNGVKFIFNKIFPSNSKTAQEARQLLRKEQGNLKSEIANMLSGKSSGFFENMGINAWSNSLESVRNLFDKIGKDGSFKFMNLMQGIVDGKARDATLSAMDKQYGLEDGTLQKALDNLRNTSDKLFDMVADHSDVNYVTDYLAGMYKDYDKARVYFAGKLSNIAGKKSFLKQKFYDNYLQAVKEGGLTPLYDNPADIVNHQVGNVMQYVYANRILDAFKDNGMAEYYPNPKDAPEGMSLVKDPIFQRKTFIPPTEEGKPAVVTETGGGWYLPNDAADMVNNKFGKGLIAPEVESSVQALNNFYVRADLSFSYFHTMMSSMNSLASQFGGAIQNLTAFKPLAALKEIARVPLAQDLVQGIKLNRDAKRIDDLKQQLTEANSKGNTNVAADLQKRINNVKMLTDANHQFNLDKQNRMDMVDAFRRSVRRNEKLPALVKAPLAAIDAFMRPLMQVYVPALKSSVAMRNAAREIELVQPNTEFERQNLINRAVDGSDEMFGQIAHDNLFFDNTLKQLGNMSALAFGYSRGTLMTLLRPITEMVNVQQGEGGGLKSETLSRLVKGKGVPVGTSNFLGIVASTCFVGAVMQKLMSGKDPESIQDLIAPRTGEKNPDGTDKRLIFSNYLSKDYYGYSKGFFHELENKSSPLIRITSELVKNKDFYGGVIMPEDEPLWNKAWDGVKFAGKEAIPFSFRHNPAKEYEAYSKGKEDLMQYFGIREASKEMERNTWQNAIVDESAKSGSEKPKTDLQLDKARLKGTAAGEIYSGDIDKGNKLLQKGVDKGYWKQSEVGKMGDEFKTNPYYRMFKELSPEGQIRVYNEITPEVQKQLKPYLHKEDVFEKLKKEMPDKADEINKVLGTSNTKEHKEHPVKVHKVGKHIKNDEQTPDEPTSENHIESKFDRNKSVIESKGDYA